MNILIIDDDSKVCDKIERFVRRYVEKRGLEYTVNIIKFENIPWMFTYFDNGNKADVIFMDIQLKDYNGIDIAAGLQEINSNMAVAFMTGYIEYAADIFNVNPFHFLVKPVTLDDIEKVMDKVIEYRKCSGKRTMCFKVENVLHCVDKRDIYYIEADRKNVYIHMKEGIYKVNDSLKNMEIQAGDVLLKCHRSYMVNPEKVRKCEKNSIELISGEIVPVSRSKSKTIGKEIYNSLFPL